VIEINPKLESLHLVKINNKVVILIINIIMETLIPKKIIKITAKHRMTVSLRKI